MKNTHLDHVEDYLFTGNFIQACDVLGSLADHLTGKTQKYLSLSMKYDGAPAVVFGVNPVNGKFFVGTKSVFNKIIQKIAYTTEDVDTLYGDSAELCDKLKDTLSALTISYFQGNIPTGVFQGDLMWTSNSLNTDDRTVMFCPNTINYRVNKESDLGKKILSARIGMVVHTEYVGPSLQDCNSIPYLKYEFLSNDKVFFINPLIYFDDFKLNELQYKTILDSLYFCETNHQGINRTIYDRHNKMLKMFVNFCIRIGEGQPEISMYETFLEKKGEILLLDEVSKQRSHFITIFMIHRHLSYIKNLILKSLKNESLFFTEVNGIPCSNEGLVVTYHGIPCKLVDRYEFSKNNFANKRFANV
jgi:hypothetical protein